MDASETQDAAHLRDVHRWLAIPCDCAGANPICPTCNGDGILIGGEFTPCGDPICPLLRGTGVN